MKFPYHFVDLDKEELQRRRYLLDNYGQFAQLSVLLLPLVYQLSVGIRLLATRSHRNAGYKPAKDHQSPVVGRFRDERTRTHVRSWQRLNWWLDDEIAPGWETRKQCLIAALWTSWLLTLIVSDTGDDYLHLTKRIGIVAASQLPIHYLLALKAWSPVQYLTRLSHEQLNPYHRLLGRIIIILFTLHATLYLNFFIQKGLLLTRLRNRDVLLGISAISSALILNTTALSRLRHNSYRLFIYTHVALSIALLPILYLHVTHLRLYILEAAAIYLLLIIQRNLSVHTTAEATITTIPDTALLLGVSIPLTPQLRSKTYHPGQHLYLGFPSLTQKLRINPFTVATLPTPHAKDIKLTVRARGGTTAILANLAEQPQLVPLTVEGFYGSGRYFPRLGEYDRVLLVAGGVGATFTLPIWEALGLEERRTGKVKFLWVARGLEDVRWGVQRLAQGEEDEEDEDEEGVEVEVYVTGSDDGGLRVEGAVEMREMGEPERKEQGWLENRLRQGRPDWRRVVDGIFEEDEGERVAVLVCGPSGLGRAVRKEVGRWVGRGRDVFWHSEEFGW